MSKQLTTSDLAKKSAASGPFYHAWHKDVRFTSSAWSRALMGGTMLFVLAGSVWAATAPIDMAFTSAGRLVAQGKNRVVDHLEGGIVKEVLVIEGDRVEKDQLLAVMDVTAASANLSNASRQRDFKRVELARYVAEQNGLAEIAWGDDLDARMGGSQELRDAASTQSAEFAAKQKEMASTVEILNQRIKSNSELIESLTALKLEREKRIVDTQEEVNVSNEMMNQGLTTRDRNFALKRQLANDQDQLRTTIIQIDEKRNVVNEARETLTRITSQRANQVAEAILRLRKEIVDFEEKIRAFSAIVERAEIRAPIGGVVVEVATNTVNQVIKPGDPLIEIFPSDLPLAIEAQVEPRYIDNLLMGQHVAVQFNSRDRSKSSVMIDGKVNYVARDSVQNQQTGMFHYTVRATLDPESIKKYGELVPGNLATVYFQLEKQTFLEYLIAPYRDVSDKAFTG